MDMYLLVTSPHPDDDQVGLCDYIQQAQKNKYTVGVWFMSDGNNRERKIEATRALNIIGVDDIFWYTMPFYTRDDRRVTERDTEKAARLLKGLCPDSIAACYDADPKGTHMKCFHILQQALNATALSPNILLYQSAWANTTSYNVPLHIPLVDIQVTDQDTKKRALRCHASQLELQTHDGFGSSLLERGNLSVETFYLTNTPGFLSLKPCLPNLQRRTTYTKDIGAYVFENHVQTLSAGNRVVFPTGQTPLGLYEYMRQKDTPSLQVFQLDEYYNSTEYREYLTAQLPKHYEFHFIDSSESTCEEEIKIHDALCQNLDLIILGIGHNGHIAFNEPPSNEMSVTRIVRLDQNTIDANATQHTMAITLGIRTILTAKKIVLMAKKNKQPILDQIFAGRKTPASALAHHPNVEIVVEA